MTTATLVQDYQATIDAAQADLDDAYEAGATKARKAHLLGIVCTARVMQERAVKYAHAQTSGPRGGRISR